MGKFDFGDIQPWNIITESHLIYHNWPGKADQKAWLLRLLPLILSEVLDSSVILSDAWQCLIYTHHVCSILCDTLWKNEYLSDLKFYIEGIVNLINKLNPNPTSRAKLHFILHYPEFVYMCGMPSMYWCMRFESMHQYFKQVYKVTNGTELNFVMRYQLKQYVRLREGPLVYPIPGKFKRIINISVPLMQLIVDCLQMHGEHVITDNFAITSSLKYRYHEYKNGKPEFVVCDSKKFLLTDGVIHYKDYWLVYGSHYDGIFDVLVQAYELCNPVLKVYICDAGIKPELHLFKSQGKLFCVCSHVL